MMRICEEGDWFAVPLGNGQFAHGITARRGKSGSVLAHFFGPPQDERQSMDQLDRLSPNEAILVARTGLLGFTGGGWVVIARSQRFDRDEWGVCAFGQLDTFIERCRVDYYDDDDPGVLVREEFAPIEWCSGLPESGQMGHVFVQQRLARLLLVGSAE
jgi:hypothetical protein